MLSCLLGGWLETTFWCTFRAVIGCGSTHRCWPGLAKMICKCTENLAGSCCSRVKAQDLSWSGDCPYSWTMGISPGHGFGWLLQVESPQIPECDSRGSRDCYAWSLWARVFSLIKAKSSLSFAFGAADKSWALFFTNRIQDLQDSFKATFRQLWSLLSPCSSVRAITSSNLLMKSVL